MDYATDPTELRGTISTTIDHPELGNFLWKGNVGPPAISGPQKSCGLVQYFDSIWAKFFGQKNPWFNIISIGLVVRLEA